MDLPKLGQSSLGNLPPLGGGGPKNLAPLKKIPSLGDEGKETKKKKAGKKDKGKEHAKKDGPGKDVEKGM